MPSILYVDHDIQRLAELRSVLGEEFDVEPAFNGWDGLGAMLMYKPEIVIFNLTAKVMTGVEALRLVRTEEKTKDLPVLGFTTPKNETIEEVSSQVGCTAIVNYPFEPELKESLQQFLQPKESIES